jgi:hypothetical protein
MGLVRPKSPQSPHSGRLAPPLAAPGEGSGGALSPVATLQRCNPPSWSSLTALRARRSNPLVGEIRTCLVTQRALPHSGLGKAIACTGGGSLLLADRVGEARGGGAPGLPRRCSPPTRPRGSITWIRAPKFHGFQDYQARPFDERIYHI